MILVPESSKKLFWLVIQRGQKKKQSGLAQLVNCPFPTRHPKRSTWAGGGRWTRCYCQQLYLLACRITLATHKDRKTLQVEGSVEKPTEWWFIFLFLLFVLSKRNKSWKCRGIMLSLAKGWVTAIERPDLPEWAWSHRMLRIPGEAYISSWRFPFRKRYSIALKSFLFTDMCFWNSALRRAMPLVSRSLPRG